MASGLVMDHTFASMPSLWANNDHKFLPDAGRAADVCTSVVVTRHIPRGASFGPCWLQSAFYDTIAFIALKSCDRITKSYVFRIDPEVLRNTALVLSWLRLVQAARSREEQNTEAHLRGGQLYVRATRDIGPEEELLVWYDQELSHLLGFTETARELHGELKCVKCSQVFKHEYPYLAHCRFLCGLQVKGDAWSHDAGGTQKDANKVMDVKRQRRVTDFHNIARDLEHKRPATDDEDADTSPDKRKCVESVYPKGRKSVLLEKTNIANDHNITPSRHSEQSSLDPPSFTLKPRADKLKTHHLDFKNNAFGEVVEREGRITHGGEHNTHGEMAMESHPSGREGSLGAPLRSAFSALSSGGLRQGDQKSAFCKPNKRTYNESTLHPSMAQQAASSSRLHGISDPFTPIRTVAGYTTVPTRTPTLMAPTRSLVTGELPAHVAISNAFHYAPQHWSRSMASPSLHTTPSLAVLPPTLTSFGGASVQNWCAKCNLSFRMTSDLVFHMRSHHKKEFAAESQVRRRREEKLTCPICHEYFRERHHLSRHMTSHN